MYNRPYRIVAAGAGLVVAGTGIVLAMVDGANKVVGYVVGSSSGVANTALPSVYTLLSFWGPLGIAAVGLGAVVYKVIKYKNGRPQQ